MTLRNGHVKKITQIITLLLLIPIAFINTAAGLVETPSSTGMYDIENGTYKKLANEVMATPHSYQRVGVYGPYVVWADTSKVISIYNVSNSTTNNVMFNDIGVIRGISIYNNSIAIYNHLGEIYIYDIDLDDIKLLYRINEDEYIKKIQLHEYYLIVISLQKEHVLNHIEIDPRIIGINLSNNNVTEIGNGMNAKIYNNDVFFHKSINNNSKKPFKIFLKNISTNSITDLGQQGRIVTIQSDYLAWLLDNGTFVINDRVSGRIFMGPENNGKMISAEGGSAYKKNIAFFDIGKNGISDIFLYNVSSGKVTQITNTKDKVELHPQIYGNIIVWTEREYIEEGIVGFLAPISIMSFLIATYVVRYKIFSNNNKS